MNIYVKNAIKIVTFMGIMSSCLGHTDELYPEKSTSVKVGIEYGSYVKSCTRSSYLWNESEIYDIQLFITDADGNIVECIYSHDTSGLEFTGNVGEEYIIYAAANIGKEVIAEYIPDLTGFEDAVIFRDNPDGGIPMVIEEPVKINIKKGNNTVTVKMVRMMARVDLVLDRSLLSNSDGFHVRRVTLHDAALGISDDSASAEDIAVLDDGGVISLYAYENLQGTLLPGNKDPWQKVPSNISGSAEKCSFIEMECSYNFNGISSDNIIYRMYLGHDNTSNFDVCRNTLYCLTFIPTEQEIYGRRGSWKIESGDWTGGSSARLYITPDTASLEEDGEPVQLHAILFITTNGVEDEGTDVTDDTIWETISGAEFTYTDKNGWYFWKDGPGESLVKARYIFDEEVECEAAISTAAPISLVSLTSSTASITLDHENQWSADYSFTAHYSNGKSETISPATGLILEFPEFVDESNGQINAKAPGTGTLKGSYTYRGITMSATIYVSSIEEWFTIGLQFKCSRNGDRFTISDVEAVKMSQFSGPHDEKYVKLHAGEFTYNVSGNIKVDETGDGFTVTARKNDEGILTVIYHCPVSDEDIYDDIIFSNGNCSHLSD